MKKKNALLSALKIFVMTLIISSGVSVIATLFLDDLGLIPASLIVILLIALGIVFDIIGVAFTSCDEKPFIAMSAKKMKRATNALKLIKKADVVSNICNDMIGDICGIVSGAAGTAIVVKIIASNPSVSEIIITTAVSALTAALTVAGKMLGKSYALKNNIKIVETIGIIISFFKRDLKNGKANNAKKEG